MGACEGTSRLGTPWARPGGRHKESHGCALRELDSVGQRGRFRSALTQPTPGSWVAVGPCQFLGLCCTCFPLGV